MIEKLFKDPEQPFKQGTVLSVNPLTYKASVKTSDGMTLQVSFNTDIEVGDVVIIAGTSTNFVVQKIRGFVPNQNAILNV